MFDGIVTTAPAVHHKDHNRSNNHPDNLEPVTSTAHGIAHRTLDYRAMAEDYKAGMSIPKVASKFGVNTGNVYRAIVAEGVAIRPSAYAQAQSTMLEMLRAGCDAICVMSVFGCSRSTVTALQRKHGIVLKPGRPSPSFLRDHAHHRNNDWVHDHPAESYELGLLRRSGS